MRDHDQMLATQLQNNRVFQSIPTQWLEVFKLSKKDTSMQKDNRQFRLRRATDGWMICLGDPMERSGSDLYKEWVISDTQNFEKSFAAIIKSTEPVPVKEESCGCKCVKKPAAGK